MPYTWYCRPCGWGLSLLLASLMGCAAPRTQLAPLPAGSVKAEEEKQRELALQENELQQNRLDSLALPILASGTSLCTADLGAPLSARFATVHQYESAWRSAASHALGLGDTLTVLSVTPGGAAARAGLRSGDRILEVQGHHIDAGPGAVKDFSNALATAKEANPSSIGVLYERGGEHQQTSVQLHRLCDYKNIVLESDELNAYSDGAAIILTSTMMRFVNDEELKVVYAHEFAHNAMGHLKAKKKNSLFGAILGAIGDIAMASQGINTGGYYTSQGAKAGAMSFSQDFEREADYVGLYAMALAGMRLEEAPSFWRHMALANPKSIGLAYTHPTTAERFVRMEQAIVEINQKRTANIALTPEMKGAKHPVFSSSNLYALGERGTDTSSSERALVPNIQPTSRAVEVATPPVERETSLHNDSSSSGYLSEKASQVGSPPPTEAGAQGYRAENDVSSSDTAFQSDPRLAGRLKELRRMKIVSYAEEVENACLVVVLGSSALASETPLAYHLSTLYSEFRERTAWDPRTTLELWYRGEKVGEYGSGGLTLRANSR